MNIITIVFIIIMIIYIVLIVKNIKANRDAQKAYDETVLSVVKQNEILKNLVDQQKEIILMLAEESE